jgi:CubicO group peptidase (beta-lactamase class C family)
LITRNKHEIFTYYKPTENDRDTAFPMGGLADLITATATLVMTDRDLIDLNQPVGAYVKDLPQAVGAIEIKHLLNHTSGLTDTSPDAPVFTPGDEVRFSARNMTLLTQAMEAVTGRAAPAIIAEEILTPLSMNGTRHENGAWETTLADLLRFEQSFYSNQVVSLKAKRDASRTSRLNDDKHGRYLAGWEVRNYKGLRLERAGGASAALWRFPNKNFAALVLADLTVADGKVEGVARAIADIYLGREMPAPNLPFE